MIPGESHTEEIIRVATMSGRVVQTRLQTDTTVYVVDNRADGDHGHFPPVRDPEVEWFTLCERHGTIKAHDSLEDAREAAARSDLWCDGCVS